MVENALQVALCAQRQRFEIATGTVKEKPAQGRGKP
jgi:hypothetical protein